jgi:hypothetical protein
MIVIESNLKNNSSDGLYYTRHLIAPFFSIENMKTWLIKNGAVFLVMILFFPAFGMLKENSDFIAQYTAGIILKRHDSSRLYEIDFQKKIQTEQKDLYFPSSPYRDELILFTQPPFTAMVYFPFAYFSYQTAKNIFNLFSLICLFIVALLFFPQSEMEKSFFHDLVFLASFFSPPICATFIQSQTSILGLLFFILTFLALKRGNDIRAGFWLSAALIRFQLLPAFLLFLLINRKWKVLSGFLAGGSFLLSISAYVVGWEGMVKYLQLAINIGTWNHQYGVSPDRAHSLRGQISSLLAFMSPTGIWIIAATISLVLLVWYLATWKGKWDTGTPQFDLGFAVLSVLSLLIAPHLNFHDLSLLILPVWIIYRLMLMGEIDKAFAKFTLFLFACFCFPILLSTHIIWEHTGIQLSVVALIFILMVLMRAKQYLKKTD